MSIVPVTSLRTTRAIVMILLLAGIYSLAGPTPTRASVGSIDYPVKAKGSDPFWRIQRKKLWGFMDRTGRVVIEPRFTYAGDFMSGLAFACVPVSSSTDPLCGYINHAGQFAIQPRFRPAGYGDFSRFTDGVAPVGTDDGVVLIDKTGEILTARPFFYIHELSDGLASVRITKPGVVPVPGKVGAQDQLFGFIDTSGRIVVEPIYRSSLRFQEGLAGISVQPGGWGYVDAAGRVVIDFKFAEVTPFSGGVATVKDRASKKWSVIDKLGRPLRPFDLIWASPFKDGFAIARGENGIGLMGPDGVPRFQLPFRGVEAPSEGLAQVEADNLLRGYVDVNGNVRIPVQYRHTTRFSEGRAAVSNDRCMNNWGYIDTTGALVIPMRFNRACEFVDGLALVQLEGEWCYIDPSGRIVARDVWGGGN
jgi:hypothetical protein